MKYLFLALSLLAAAPLYSNDLVKGSKSDYRIFIAANAPAPEQHAARELQQYLQQISGCRLAITHSAPPGARLVYVGFEGAPAALTAGLHPQRFGKEEYIIRSDGNSLLIAGGAPRGALYGVMGYLADHLHCRWYTREVTKVPRQSTIALTKLEDRQQPSFGYREAWFREAYQPQWALHNRLNPSGVPLPDSLGGSYISYPFVHTFNLLVPAAKYYDAHPEYFAEVNGKRLNGPHAQLCLTNPAVLNIAMAGVFSWIKEHPEADIFSIDQNDYGGNCTCAACKRVDEAEGSPAGSLLYFVNRIADSVAKVYPHVQLQTLAYDYTEAPPKNVRPADNVTIRLCHYGYCCNHAIGNCEDHQPFVERVTAWQKIAKRISVWDYYTDFAQYLMPFPNFESFKHNIKWYADHGVKGIFAQGNNVPDNGGGEFSELRAWVIAQLLWNAERNPDELVNEFVTNVYGKAAPFISAYIRLIHREVEASGSHTGIWLGPEQVEYFSVPVMRQADSLFTRAFKAAAGDAPLTERVELAYLPVLYLKLAFYTTGGTDYLAKEALAPARNRFKKIIARHRIKAISEDEKNYGNLAKFLESIERPATFYTDWWVIGSFSDPDTTGLKTPFPPESSLDVSRTYTGKNGSAAAWKPYRNSASGYVDFTRIFPLKENVVAYAQRTVTTTVPKPVKFGVGSNDGVRVWVNGELVLDRPVARKAQPHQDVVEVHLKKGENKILVKVDQLKSGWGFYFAELN